MTENFMEEFVEAYANDPVRFVREMLGAEPFDYQIEFLEAVANHTRKMSVKAGHGVGKSTTAAWAMLWFLMLKYPCKIVVTAPTSSQLFDAMYAELKRWINELPKELQQLLNVKSDRVELVAAPAEAFISCRTARPETPEALAGVHSENVLLVIDESSGIAEKIFESAAGSMSGHNATTLMLSNPTRSSGTFFESHNRLSHAWWTRTWSCIESPLVSDEFVDERHGTKRKKDSQAKRRSLNSVKVLRICTQINAELEQKQKVIVLVEVLEFIFADVNHTEKEIAFAETVSQTFNISAEEYNEIFQFVSETPNNLANHENHLSITSKESSKERKDKHILAKGIIGEISILRVQSIKTYFTRYFGKQEIFLNGQALPPQVIKVLRQGSSIKNPRITPIYYSDVIAQFLSEESTEKIEFTAAVCKIKRTTTTIN